MDKKRMQNIEDALYSFFLSRVEPEIEEVDRFAENISAEVNRYKREQRRANKKAKEILQSCAALNKDGTLFKPECSDNNPDEHWIHSAHILVEFIDQLERNVPISKEVERILGVSFDYTKLSQSTKKMDKMASCCADYRIGKS